MNGPYFQNKNAKTFGMLRRDVAPKIEAYKRVAAEGEDGYCNGTKGLLVGIHYYPSLFNIYLLPFTVLDL
jgi:hypothetical protein